MQHPGGCSRCNHSHTKKQRCCRWDHEGACEAGKEGRPSSPSSRGACVELQAIQNLVIFINVFACLLKLRQKSPIFTCLSLHLQKKSINLRPAQNQVVVRDGPNAAGHRQRAGHHQAATEVRGRIYLFLY